MSAYAKRIRRCVAHAGWWVPRRAWTHAHCLFLLSTGRTGTATIAKLLGLSGEIWASHEPEPKLISERKAAFQSVWSDQQRFWRTFARARGPRIAWSRFRRKIYAETSARMTFFAPVIAENMPNSRFLYVYRHPGDVVRSGMRRAWYGSHPLDAERIEPTSNDPAYAHWDTWDRFTKICWYWEAYNRFALDFLEGVDRRRVLRARCEDLLDAATGEYCRLFQILRVPAPPEGPVRQVLSVKHNQQCKGDFPRFEQWTPQQRETLHRIAGQTMVRLGYMEPTECPRQGVDG